MCELYVKADPILYESRSRSLRIRGVVTTVRLENQCWDVLQEIAEVDGVPVAYSEVAPGSMPHPDCKPENAELKRANAILRSASAFFAAELDRPQH